MSNWDALDYLGAIFTGGLSAGASAYRHGSAVDQASSQVSAASAAQAAARKQAMANATNQNGGAGVQQVSGQRTASPGLAGFVGGTEDYPIYAPAIQKDPRYATNRNAVDALSSVVNAMPVRQMGATTADPTQQAEWRAKQMGLAGQLQDQANGIGPSVAGSQLQQSTEQNLQAALAQAASSRGGNIGAMQYQLGNNRAGIQQQAAMGLAQNRIQEQMAARSQLGQVLGEGRGADIGMAQFNAGQMQSAGAANLQAGIAQDQYKQSLKAQLLQQGYNEDQANLMLGIQQGQFNAGLLNQGVAAAHGLSIQSAGQAAQLGGATMSALGSGIGSIGSALQGVSKAGAATAGAGKAVEDAAMWI